MQVVPQPLHSWDCVDLGLFASIDYLYKQSQQQKVIRKV